MANYDVPTNPTMTTGVRKLESSDKVLASVFNDTLEPILDNTFYLENSKAAKVKNATSGNFASLDANGNLADSGKKAGDFANASHTHDDRYYTESEMDTKLNTKANAASITAGTAGTSSATSGSSLDVPYVTTNAQGIVTGYGTHKHTVTGFAASSHTHSYAGSSSAGGAATTAVSAATTTPATASLKNIQASTTDLTAGTSALTTGTVYLVYE